MVLISQQTEGADHEDACKPSERADRTVSVGRVFRDDTKVDRQGDEYQTNQSRSATADHEKEIMPLFRLINRNIHTLSGYAVGAN
jgi:hypothetical protein